MQQSAVRKPVSAESCRTAPMVSFPGGRELKKGKATRERILAIAQASVLAKGFAATSIDEIIAEAGITKSGFFYHFRDKNELAYEMLSRYVAENDAVLEDVFGRARQLSDDPLQAFLIGLKLFAELVRDLPTGHPGCLIASVVYQERLFDRRVRDFVREACQKWDTRFRAYLDEIAHAYPPRGGTDLDDLAKMCQTIVDGGIIMSKVLQDPRQLERQIMLFRSLVKLVFQPG